MNKGMKQNGALVQSALEQQEFQIKCAEGFIEFTRVLVASLDANSANRERVRNIASIMKLESKTLEEIIERTKMLNRMLSHLYSQLKENE